MLRGFRAFTEDRQQLVFQDALVFKRLHSVQMLAGGLLKFTFTLHSDVDDSEAPNAVCVFMDRAEVVDAAKDALLVALGLKRLIRDRPVKRFH